MSIRQQGGVFGRNPTFNNVTVDGILTVDQVVEKTGATGITLDGVTLKDGNVVLADGKGIDFSATAGAGTSELFDDYEEGTWTPVYTASTTDPTFASYPVRSAHYRKIGAMVFVTARFRTSGYNSDGVGNLRISGLPYAAKSSGSFFDTGGITIHSVQNWGSIPSNGVVKPGDAFISLIGSTGFVDQSVLALGTGTNNNDISFSGMYVTD